MSEKRFTIHKESKYKEEWYAYPFCIKEDGEVVLETIPLSIAEKVRDKLNEQQAEIEMLKKELEPKFEDNQETEVRECQFCGEFRTEYHEYEDYSWSAEDYCNAGHDLEDTDPNNCKDYWDK